MKPKADVSFSATKITNLLNFRSSRAASPKGDVDADCCNAGKTKGISWNPRQLSRYTLTIIDKIFTITDEFEQFLNIKNGYQLSQNDDNHRTAYINGLCVFGECFNIITYEH